MEAYNDSISENLTPNYHINTIRLLLNEDVENKKTVVLLEGEDDVRLAKNILDDQDCSFHSCIGKEMLMRLIESESPLDARLIAIRDRDYLQVKNRGCKLFFYDCCSMELMMLYNQEIKKRLRVCCISQELQADFPIQILRQLAPFSILRKKNEQENLNLCLKGGALSGGKKANKPYLLDIEKAFSQCKAQDYWCDCRKQADETKDEELWNITNGHDLCAFLGSNSTMTENKGPKLGEQSYRSLMIKMYRKEDFKQTKLYAALLDYQNRHELSIVTDEAV